MSDCGAQHIAVHCLPGRGRSGLRPSKLEGDCLFQLRKLHFMDAVTNPRSSCSGEVSWWQGRSTAGLGAVGQWAAGRRLWLYSRLVCFRAPGPHPCLLLPRSSRRDCPRPSGSALAREHPCHCSCHCVGSSCRSLANHLFCRLLVSSSATWHLPCPCSYHQRPRSSSPTVLKVGALCQLLSGSEKQGQSNTGNTRDLP